MKYMMKMGVFQVVGERLRQRLQTSHVEMGGQDERRVMPFKIGLSRATWDVSRAHFYGEARKWIYTYLFE